MPRRPYRAVTVAVLLTVSLVATACTGQRPALIDDPPPTTTVPEPAG